MIPRLLRTSSVADVHPQHTRPYDKWHSEDNQLRHVCSGKFSWSTTYHDGGTDWARYFSMEANDGELNLGFPSRARFSTGNVVRSGERSANGKRRWTWYLGSSL
jgi:hypothetical protein